VKAPARLWLAGRAGGLLALAILSTPATLRAALPPVPVPPENPLSEEKRVLGKALFWEEQLSSDNTIACGSCHRPGAGGADPRAGVHPGPDGLRGTADDIHGSPGVRRRNAIGQAIADAIFEDGLQVTRRLAPSIYTSLWAAEIFWDGRAGSEFRDPLTGEIVLATGGALEAQALHPILDPTEMAYEGRSWAEVADKLGRVRPLALAAEVPADLAAATSDGQGYPQLFAAAFGDTSIDPVRIAFAIASYERTLVPDQTPWDRYDGGETDALDAEQISGLAVFMNAGACRACHVLPLFSNDEFRNTGVRPPQEDPGRRTVTGAAGDRGKFKVPSLRNVGLRPRLMHNGRFTSFARVFDFYTGSGGEQSYGDNRDPHVAVIDIPEFGRAALLAFLRDGLTDQRVARAEFPFDRPRLRSEILSGGAPVGAEPSFLPHAAAPNPFFQQTLLSFTLLRPATVNIHIYAANGRLVRRMLLPKGSVGWHEVVWDGSDGDGGRLASGVYLYEIQTETQRATGRVTILR
jgi:cytochrome c peroxidase